MFMRRRGGVLVTSQLHYSVYASFYEFTGLHSIQIVFEVVLDGLMPPFNKVLVWVQGSNT